MMNLSGIPRALGGFGDDAGKLFQHWRKNAQSLAMEIPHAFVSFFGPMTTDLNPYLLRAQNFIDTSNQVAIVRTFPSAKPIDSAFKFLI